MKVWKKTKRSNKRGKYFTPFGQVCQGLGVRWCLSSNVTGELYRILYKAGRGWQCLKAGVRLVGGAPSGCTTCGPVGADRWGGWVGGAGKGAAPAGPTERSGPRGCVGGGSQWCCCLWATGCRAVPGRPGHSYASWRRRYSRWHPADTKTPSVWEIISWIILADNHQ